MAGPGSADRPAVVTGRARTDPRPPRAVPGAGTASSRLAVVVVVVLARLGAGPHAGAALRAAAGAIAPPSIAAKSAGRTRRPGRPPRRRRSGPRVDLEGDQPVAALDLDAELAQLHPRPAHDLAAGPRALPGTLTRTFSWTRPLGVGASTLRQGRPGRLPTPPSIRGRARRRGSPAPPRRPPSPWDRPVLHRRPAAPLAEPHRPLPPVRGSDGSHRPCARR